MIFVGKADQSQHLFKLIQFPVNICYAVGHWYYLPSLFPSPFQDLTFQVKGLLFGRLYGEKLSTFG